jgi:hypothetical protein
MSLAVSSFWAAFFLSAGAASAAFRVVLALSAFGGAVWRIPTKIFDAPSKP